MNTDFSVRQLGIGDRDSYFSFRLRALETYPQGFATSAEEWRNAPPDKIDALLLASEKNSDPILGAFTSNSELIGSLGLSRETRMAVQHKVSLVAMYVDPAFRRNGVGTQLVTEALELARQQPGLVLVRLVVDSENTDAVQLFERLGFVHYGREPLARRVEERYYDQSYMLYLLHSPKS
jgi:ribosomal protein S18 acetylase RimI-like enzyme